MYWRQEEIQHCTYSFLFSKSTEEIVNVNGTWQSARTIHSQRIPSIYHIWTRWISLLVELWSPIFGRVTQQNICWVLQLIQLKDSRWCIAHLTFVLHMLVYQGEHNILTLSETMKFIRTRSKNPVTRSKSSFCCLFIKFVHRN